MSSQRFTQFWAAETIRQQEAKAGPLADDAANRRAQAAPNAENFVLQRALHLASEQQLIATMRGYQQRILAGLWLVFLFACLSGAGLALNLAPQSARVISLIEAVSVIILTNLLFILLWLMTVLRRQAPRGLGYWLQYYLHKLTRDHQRLAVAQSYTRLCAQQGLLKPALSSISHGVWATILIAVLTILTLRFIAYDYQFVWQTTLLSSGQINALIDTLHIAPGLLGIERPFVDSATQASANPRATAIWLLSCILLYALLPRVILLVTCEWLRRKRLRQLQLDWTKPGYAQLRALFASGTPQEIDPAPADIEVLPRSAFAAPVKTDSEGMLMTLELPLEAANHLAGKVSSHPVLTWSANISSANDRRLWLNNLAAYRTRHDNAAPQVVLVINPLLSPDRGSLRFIEALTHYAQLTLVVGLQGSVRGQLWVDAVRTHLPAIRVLTQATGQPDPQANEDSAELTSQWSRCCTEIEEIIDQWKA